MPGHALSERRHVAADAIAAPRCAWRITVRGRVQGTGFRPHVYRLAQRIGLNGKVRNVAQGVEITVEGMEASLEEFRMLLERNAPPAAAVESIAVEEVEPQGATEFAIEESGEGTERKVRVLPDLATCSACRHEILDPEDRRQGYPFTSCTGCGPRYSIIAALPYDRPATTMASFRQCHECAAEYLDSDDRRFHAQTNACPTCGPQIALWDQAGHQVAGPAEALSLAAKLLRGGHVLALKGLGGFQLIVRADDAAAVRRLRERKQRPAKPFAVMVVSAAQAAQLAVLGRAERDLLASSENPIVLLRQRAGANGVALAEVAPRLSTLGLFLPTTPLHHMSLAAAGGPLVVTSGNRGDEPLVTDEREAPKRLAGIADAFLVHDRPILRRVDDSVVCVIAGRPTVLRLARGYAPLPLPALERFADCPPVLAVGGHHKVALAFWTGQQAVLTQHIGDMDTAETRAAFVTGVADVCKLYRFEPAVVVCDAHPDYFTTRWAHSLGKPVIAVQHHHAHAAACMAEHDLLNREVLAFAWDGTGYGPDGTIWGGEALRATAGGFRRVASLLPFPLPGGEAAIRHPNRSAFGLLLSAFGQQSACATRRLEQLGLEPSEARVLAAMCAQRVGTPWTSSMGRLFDALAALVLGIREVSYEGEAAVMLESVADEDVTDAYPLLQRWADGSGLARGDWRPLLEAVLADLDRDVAPGLIAGRFHNALAQWAAAVAAAEGLSDVLLSGGCFQNRLLAERTREALQNRRIYLHGLVPPGDGGLAAGQLAVALHQLHGRSAS